VRRAGRVKDGVIDSPDRCKFDPEVLKCTGADEPTCLTGPQVETARTIYGIVSVPGMGAVVNFPLLHPGSELVWGTLAGPQPYAIALEMYKYVVFKNPNWDWHTFNPATDVHLLDAAADALTPPSANLKPFFKRGGKLLMYHGWADQQVAPLNSVTYFDAVTKAAGNNVAGKSIALYMVPGMGHCQGGAGTDSFDKVAAVEQWISTGRAPAEIVASHMAAGRVDRTRPLCPYPQVAKYQGSGSTDEASHFACVRPAVLHPGAVF
jgi:feruloyl esterase